MQYDRAVLTGMGDPHMLQLITDDIPTPRANEVRVKVLAAGVAYADILMRRGKYPARQSSRLRLGMISSVR